MAIPGYTSVSILSYSPVFGVRRATGVPLALLQDADSRTSEFVADATQLTALTKQSDPKLRLTFGFWAFDNAPTPELRDRIPLEVMIVHYVRTLPAWSMLGRAPALNIVTLDWPIDGGYEVRAYLFGASAPMPPEQLMFFYEKQREQFNPEIAKLMPAPNIKH